MSVVAILTWWSDKREEKICRSSRNSFVADENPNWVRGLHHSSIFRQVGSELGGSFVVESNLQGWPSLFLIRVLIWSLVAGLGTDDQNV